MFLKVLLAVNQHADSREVIHIVHLTREKRVVVEVWENDPHKILNLAHLILECAIRPVWSDEPTSPKFLDSKQQLSAVCVLADRETRPDFPPEPMTSARLERNTEAPFAVHESGDV